jgi:hypothetical protein
MPSVARSQLTLDFEPTLPERFNTLRAFVAHRAMVVDKPLKVQAADMDLSPSVLSRKLNPNEGDTQRLNLDDFENWLASTGDAAAIVEYLAAKYLDDDGARKQRAISKLEAMLPELACLLAAAKEGA